jgi:hypothetical protein
MAKKSKKNLAGLEVISGLLGFDMETYYKLSQERSGLPGFVLAGISCEGQHTLGFSLGCKITPFALDLISTEINTAYSKPRIINVTRI